MANYADYEVNGYFVEPSMMSYTEVVRTTDSIDYEIKQVASMHSATFWLEWSEG